MHNQFLLFTVFPHTANAQNLQSKCRSKPASLQSITHTHTKFR